LNIKNIAVLGAGIMGRGIAHVSCFGGFQTILYDISEEMLEAASASIKKNYDKTVEKNLLTVEQAKEAVSKLVLKQDLQEAVSEADFVIEAVPEKIDLKVELYGQLNQMCKPETIFASNTSSLSITEMAAATERPQQFIGMHFFNPVHIMKLVEIVKGLETARKPLLRRKQSVKKWVKRP